MIKSTIRTYVILSILFNLGISFIGAIYVVFLTSKGLTIFEAQAVNAFCFAALTLFEVPTGFIADIFGRKISFIVACILMSAGMFIYGISESFWGFVLAEVISAIGMTFSSGAFQAWFVDAMDHHGYDKPLGRIFALKGQFSTAAMMIGGLFGAYLADIDLSMPWFAGSALYIVTAVLAVAMIEERHFKRSISNARGIVSAFRNMINVDVREGLKNNGVRFVVAMSFIQFISLQAPNMEWQIVFKPYFDSNIGLGFVKAAINIALFAGGFIAMKYMAKSRVSPVTMMITQVVIGMSVAMAVLPQGGSAVFALFMAHEIGRGAYDPIRDAYLNERVSSRSRATMLSVEAMARRFGGTIGLVISGLIATVSIPVAWISSGMFLCISGITAFLIFGKRSE